MTKDSNQSRDFEAPKSINCTQLQELCKKGKTIVGGQTYSLGSQNRVQPQAIEKCCEDYGTGATLVKQAGNKCTYKLPNGDHVELECDQKSAGSKPGSKY